MSKHMVGDGYPDSSGWLSRGQAYRGMVAEQKRKEKETVKDLKYRLLLAKTLYWEKRCKDKGIEL